MQDRYYGPGHSPKGRSLSVKIDVNSPDLFIVHSFAKDDFRKCRDYVKQRLGISDRPSGQVGHTGATQAQSFRPRHRTALKPEGGGKAEMPDGTSPKKMLGRAKGAVVKLNANDDVTTGLGICEGIEDALTIIGAGWRPMRAALSAGGIASFPVLPGIECLTIFGDADSTGLAAAQECQDRWRVAGRECPIVLPPAGNTDWNAWRAA